MSAESSDSREERFQSLLDSLEGIIWTADGDLTFTFVSKESERLLGYPAAEWLRPGFWIEHVHPDDRDWAVSFCLERTRAHQPHEFTYRMITREGRVVWLHDYVTIAFEGGDFVGLQGLMVDITSQKEAEADRDRLQEDLERSVAQIAIVSHELRGPLTPLTLALETLDRLPDGAPLEDARHRLVSRAQRQVRRLDGLITDLLEMAHLRRRTVSLRPEPLDLSALVQDVVARFKSETERAGCRVEIAAPRPVVGRWDHSRLEQVVTNLLSNAIKFGRQTPIEISVRAEGSRAYLAVRDHGRGIPQERLHHIFNAFERAVQASEVGGLGLGLYVVRSLVELHGGSVRVESELGKGATFTVELPLESAGIPLDDAHAANPPLQPRPH